MSTAYEDAMAELKELQGSNAIIYWMPRIVEVSGPSAQFDGGARCETGVEGRVHSDPVKCSGQSSTPDIWGFLAAIGVLGFYVLSAVAFGFVAVDLWMKWRR